MPILKPNQIVLVIVIAAGGTLLAYQIFNVYQAVCMGIILAILTYSVILSWQERQPPPPKH